MQSTQWLLYTEQALSEWFNFALCGLIGIITTYIFVWIAKYYTDYKHEPVRILAFSNSTGHGTNITAGVSLGLNLLLFMSLSSVCQLSHLSDCVHVTFISWLFSWFFSNVVLILRVYGRCIFFCLRRVPFSNTIRKYAFYIDYLWLSTSFHNNDLL